MKPLEVKCKVLIVGGPIENLGKEGIITGYILVGETKYWRVEANGPLWGYSPPRGTFETANAVGFKTNELRRIDGEEFNESDTSKSKETPSASSIQSPCRTSTSEV